jgi:UDP:flavonoid glycosyltransferase YjiC (YdhE family)
MRSPPASTRELGVGVPATPSSDELRAAIASTLGDDAMADRARAFAAAVDVNAGLSRAIELLEGMLPKSSVAGERS